MLFLIGIFSSLSVRSHHIYGSRIDYSFIGTRTQNGQQQIQYQIRVIINTDGSNLNGPNNKSLILRYTDLSNGQSANLSLTYQTSNDNNSACLFFRSFTFQTQHWFNADRWYRLEFAEDYVNGNVVSNCPVNNGHNFDLMCCPVALSNRANNLRSGVNISVGTSSGQVCNIDNSNLESWYASGAITEFFAHPSNTSSPNYNSNQQNGTYTFGNVVRAHRNSLNTFNFNISAANATIQLHVARPPVLNPIYDINYNLLPSTSLWAANMASNHNISVENNRTFQFSSGLDWQNPLPSVTPVQTAGTTLSIHPNSQTFFNQGYYMGLLVNQIPNNSTIPNCKQLMACVVYIELEPTNLTVTSASCNEKYTRICGISSTSTQISISTDGQYWQNYAVNNGCVQIPFNQSQHGNGFTIWVRDPKTCQVFTLDVPSANLTCCEDTHFGNNCESQISNYNFAFLNNPSNQLNQRRKVSMSGVIRINTDVTINNCDVLMMPGTLLFIESGRKLTITNSHLRACDTLWQGIRTTNATNNNAQIIIDNSTIEDAFMAVEANNASINVRNSTFRNNYYHIQAILSHVSPLENNVFTCQMNNQTNSGRIKPHYTGWACSFMTAMTVPNTNRVTQTAVAIVFPLDTVIFNSNTFERAYTGLFITDGNYVLNHTGLPEFKNSFRNLFEFGIRGSVFNPNNSKSTLTMQNNRFNNIRNTLPTKGFGALILSTAVRITGFNLAAYSNRFTNIAFVSIYADKKRRNSGETNRSYDIQNNTFSFGGLIDFLAIDNPNALFEIHGNEFLGKINANTTAIYIANVFTHTLYHNEPVTITDNRIVNKSNGIYLAQVRPVLIQNNLIRLSDINPNQTRNFGIKVENYGSTDIGKIYSNTINMAPGNIPTPLHVGIELNSVTNVNVANNLIDGLGRGFWFSGDNRQNEIECNMVRDYEVGWVITNSTGLGTQGMGSLPQDNQWVIRNNQTAFNKLWDIEAIAAGQTKIWYRPANGLPYKPIDINDPISVTIQQSGLYTNNDCSPNPGSNKDDLITGDRRLPTTTLEELALKRESMENTYRILMASSNLTPDQILYRDSLDAISVGYYGKLIDSLYAKNVSYTEQMLAQTNCTCPIDESMKRVMEVYTKTFAVGIDTFTAGQLDTLMEIAYIPKHLSHRAVVSARIMLKMGYDITLDFESDLAVSPKIVKTEDLQTIEPIYTQVYPNPAYETIWIECPIGSEILITDLLGKTYIKTQNQAEMVSIDLQALPSGMYFIKIVHDDFVNTHKVVINKK